MIKEYWSSFNIENCLNELLDKGFVKLPSIKEINLEKFSKNIISDLDGSTFAELPRSHQDFLDFFELEKYLAPKLFEIAVKKYKFKGEYSDQYHISRMIIPGNNKESFRTHFDSHLFTMVIPLKIPKRKKSNQHIESSDWLEAEKLELRVVNSNEYSWLSKGEIIKSEIHGILEYTSPNPILRMINSLVLLFMAICGFKQKAKLIVTNKRTIVDVRNYSLWVLEKGIDTITINKANLITTGYNSSLFIFKKSISRFI